MKGRVVFHVRLKNGREGDFLRAYEAVRSSVAGGVRGHLGDQICKSIDDPRDWLITSEWEAIDCFLDWERDPEHRALVAPMRECWDESRSLRYVVRSETYRVANSEGDAR